jgi:hypothetical protein
VTFSLISIYIYPCHNAEILRNKKKIEQELILESDSEEVTSSDSDSDNGHDKSSATVGCDISESASQVHILSRQHFWTVRQTHKGMLGGLDGKILTLKWGDM